MSCWRDERGFTLAELLTAFTVLVLVLAAVTTIHQSTLQAYVTGSNKTEVQQNVRVALERMTREIRQTAVNPATGLACLTAAPSATSLSFYDQDTGLTTYALVGTTLTRTANGVDGSVIGKVQVLTFVYFDVNNTVLPPPVGIPCNVFRVDITVQTASEDTIVAGGIADTKAQLTTSVRLRNL
jgi:Tfp pilus assembly protein PilE